MEPNCFFTRDKTDHGKNLIRHVRTGKIAADILSKTLQKPYSYQSRKHSQQF